MNPTHISDKEIVEKWWNKKHISSISHIQSNLIDIFSQTLEKTNTQNWTLSLEEIYSKSLQQIMAYWQWDLVWPLKKSLWKNKKDTLSYSDVRDVKISLNDIIEAFKSISVRSKLLPEHDTVIAKAFLSRIETTIQSFSVEIWNIFKTVILDNAQYIFSLEYLWKWLQKFFDECKKAWTELPLDDIDKIHDTTISFSDIELQSSITGLTTKEEIKKSRIAWKIPTNSSQEKLLNTHMTLYWVSKIQTIFNKYKNTENRLKTAYDFWWIEDIWSWLWISDSILADTYPELKVVLEDPTVSDADKFVARMKWVGDYLSAQNNLLWWVLTKLSQNGMNFSLLIDTDQQIYLDAFKGSWIQSKKWTDLIDYFDSFWVDKKEALWLIDMFFSTKNESISVKSKQWDDITVKVDKLLFSWKTLEENCHLLQTQWLPFSFTLSGEWLSTNELKKIHTKKDWFYADKIPDALTIIIWAKALGDMSNEEFEWISKELQEKVNQKTFATENAWLHGNFSWWVDEFEEKIDWGDQESIQALTQDELQEAKQLYTKQIAWIKWDISKIQADEKSLSEDLKVINESLVKPKSLTKEEKLELENKKWKLLEERRQLNTALQELQWDKEDSEQKKKDLESIIHTKKKQTSVDPLDQEKTGSEIVVPKKEVEDQIDYYKEAESKWKDIEWDKNAPFAIWSSICMDIPDVKSPLKWWKNPWARWEIVSIDEDGNFELKMTGIDEPLHGKNQEGKAIEGSIIKFYWASGIDEFQWKVWKMWKFGKQTSWKDFWMYLKDKWLDFKDKEYKDNLKNFLDKVDFGSMYRKNEDWKILDSENNKIKYLWGNIDDLAPWDKPWDETVKTQKVWYEVTQHDDWATVSWKDRDWNPYSKKMNPQEFLVFVTDKWLLTYTQNEVDKINTDRAGKWLDSLQSEIDRSYDIPAKKKRIWTNLKSIAHTFKFWLDGVKKWLKDKQSKDNKKLERAMLWSKWFQSLSKLPIIWDAFEDMYIWLDKELDQEKTKEIKEAMEEPEKNGADTSDGPYEYILWAGKFKEVANWWTLTDEKKARKFAWYYCYVLSKKAPYSRVLGEFAGQWVWVRWILGADYQEQYIKYINQLKDNVEKNPNDWESQKLLANAELWFMKKVYGDWDQNLKDRLNGIYGKLFFTKTLSDFETEIFDIWTVEDVAKKAKNKLFNDAKWDYDKAFSQQRMIDMYGTLKGMGENIKNDPSYYREWMLRLALPVLSWATVNHMDAPLRKDYAMLARQYASPFWLYAKDADWQKRLWELFGVVSQDSSVGANFLERFAKYMPTETENRPTEKQYPDFLKELNTRWFNHGDKMLDLLSQPWKLIQIKSELEKEYGNTSDSSPRKQELLNKILAIRHYIDKKVLEDEQWEVEVKLWGIVAEKNIINLWPWAIRKLLTYRNWWFQKELVEDWPKAWKALSKQIKSYNPPNGGKASKDLYQFVLKKFLLFFEEKAHFTSTNLKSLLLGLKYADTPWVMDSYIMDIINPDGKMAPKDVLDAITAFQDFLKLHKPNDDDMKKILDTVVDKGVWDLYATIGTSWVKDQWKKAINQKRTFAEQAINKLEKKNILISWNDRISIFMDRDRRYRDEFGNVLTLKKWWNKKWQDNNVVLFDVSESLNWPITATLECPNFIEKDIKIWSYEKEVLEEGNEYSNTFDWFEWFGWY